ncbi:hypothetical protein PMKS-001786 [Pichia membranifaciens]|uniref:Uncharacterized protein n=1 Tax=Pichia membranifaciens TaxID=4926 RepID=A0A1Q2YFR5_9ASCO|nr:hypothetical protein PMKS-001786 [Pichia membranifaciens]
MLLKLSDSELELYRRYLERLIMLSTDDKFPEKVKLEAKISSTFEEILKKFPDQQSIFTIKFAKFLMLKGKFDDAAQTLEARLNSSLTIKDFSLIYDSLTEILEQKISELSEMNADETELNKYLNKLEFLLSNRLLLMNDVKLRQNTNSPSTWLERVQIFKKEGERSLNKLLECYSKAVLSMDPKKIPNDEKIQFPQVWCDYAKVYIDSGEIQTARTLFETATKVPWTGMEQLECIWIAFELDNGDENTYKDMLRRKRYLENVFGPIEPASAVSADLAKPTEESANARIRKEIQNRIGFVASSQDPKTTQATVGQSPQASQDSGDGSDGGGRNDDAIELDMDF